MICEPFHIPAFWSALEINLSPRDNISLLGPHRWDTRDLHWNSKRPTLSVAPEGYPLARIATIYGNSPWDFSGCTATAWTL
jgi:hypothetical protein